MTRITPHSVEMGWFDDKGSTPLGGAAFSIRWDPIERTWTNIYVNVERSPLVAKCGHLSVGARRSMDAEHDSFGMESISGMFQRLDVRDPSARKGQAARVTFHDRSGARPAWGSPAGSVKGETASADQSPNVLGRSHATTASALTATSDPADAFETPRGGPRERISLGHALGSSPEMRLPSIRSAKPSSLPRRPAVAAPLSARRPSSLKVHRPSPRVTLRNLWPNVPSGPPSSHKSRTPPSPLNVGQSSWGGLEPVGHLSRTGFVPARDMHSLEVSLAERFHEESLDLSDELEARMDVNTPQAESPGPFRSVASRREGGRFSAPTSSDSPRRVSPTPPLTGHRRRHESLGETSDRPLPDQSAFTASEASSFHAAGSPRALSPTVAALAYPPTPTRSPKGYTAFKGGRSRTGQTDPLSLTRLLVLDEDESAPLDLDSCVPPSTSMKTRTGPMLVSDNDDDDDAFEEDDDVFGRGSDAVVRQLSLEEAPSTRANSQNDGQLVPMALDFSSPFNGRTPDRHSPREDDVAVALRFDDDDDDEEVVKDAELEAAVGMHRHSAPEEEEEEESLPLSFVPFEGFDCAYDNLGSMGQGSFSVVFKAMCRRSRRVFAVKRSLRHIVSLAARERLLQEIVLAKRAGRHPFLLQYHDAWQEGGHLFIRTEYCARATLARAASLAAKGELLAAERPLVTPTGSADIEDQGWTNTHADPPRLLRLDSTLHTHIPSGVLPERAIWTVIAQLASALEHLHKTSILHLDVKPSNVLVHRDGSLRLGDMGTAILMEHHHHHSSSSSSAALPEQHQVTSSLSPGSVASGADDGDSRYLAPEMLLPGGATPAADVFSLGVLVFELAWALLPPTGGEAWHSLRSERLPSLMRALRPLRSTELLDLTRAMLRHDPADRITLATVLEMPQCQEAMSDASFFLSLPCPESDTDPVSLKPSLPGWDGLPAAAIGRAPSWSEAMLVEAPPHSEEEWRFTSPPPDVKPQLPPTSMKRSREESLREGHFLSDEGWEEDMPARRLRGHTDPPPPRIDIPGETASPPLVTPVDAVGSLWTATLNWMAVPPRTQ
jgi:serine/threonine protein kinase